MCSVAHFSHFRSTIVGGRMSTHTYVVVVCDCVGMTGPRLSKFNIYHYYELSQIRDGVRRLDLYTAVLSVGPCLAVFYFTPINNVYQSW